jgi:hypothetical protein
MSKRFSILAAALAASGRSDLTAFIGRSSSRMRELPTRQVDDISIERTRFVYADPEEEVSKSDAAYSFVPSDFPFGP